MSDIIKVLIVDDSAFMRTTLRSIIRKQKDMQIVGVAKDGLEGVQMAKELQPHAITLDVEMPRMDGLTAIKPILKACNAAVLMVSSLTTSSSQAALTAMRNGASDVLAKENPDKLGGGWSMERELVMKIRAIAHSKIEKTERKSLMERIRERQQNANASSEALRSTIRRRIDTSSSDTLLKGASSSFLEKEEYRIPASVSRTPLSLKGSDFDILLIGSSTGGPPVLETLFTKFPAQMPMPIVVAQHMPLLFTKSMSDRLNRVCALEVHHVEQGTELKKGHAYICPGGNHTHLKKKSTGQIYCHVGPEPESALYKPSVDVLFDSGSAIYGARSLGVVLTGMGEDGRIGAEALVKRGGQVIAQTEESCVVYGMPRAVTEHNLIKASLDPDQISQSLNSLS